MVRVKDIVIEVDGVDYSTEIFLYDGVDVMTAICYDCDLSEKCGGVILEICEYIEVEKNFKKVVIK